MNRSPRARRGLLAGTILIGCLLYGAVTDLSAEGLSAVGGAAARDPGLLQDTPFREMITAAATRAGVDPALVGAMVAVESAFNPLAVSPKGAMGLMQLMPETARLYGVSNAFDPRQNLTAGARHLRDLLQLFSGDLARALAAYNAGAHAVLMHGGIPPYRETLGFVRMVLARYQPARVRPSSFLAPAGAPPVQETRAQAEAWEEVSPARLVRAAARRLVTPGVRGPLVEIKDAPAISVRSREYPSLRSRPLSPSAGD
jgi:hypothetical protein